MGFLADKLVVAKYRWRFRKGPVGFWSSRAGGGGFDMVHWFAVRFNADGSGTLWWSGEPGERPPGEQEFKWRCVGKRRIEIKTEDQGDWDVISYDFSVRRTEYDVAEVCLEQAGQVGFWVSPYPMAHTKRGPAT